MAIVNEMNRALTAEEQQIAESFAKRLAGEDVSVPRLREFLATPSAKILLPQTIIGQVRMAAEPMYIGTKLLKRIRMDNASNIIIFPSIGVMRAFDVAEGQEIPAQNLDWQTHEGNHIRVGKSGVRVQVTQEMVDDSQWDIISLTLEQAGRALARLKEEKVFRQFSTFGHVAFDNALRATNPDAGTNGRAYDDTLNDTMSVEDFLDLIITVMNNEFTPDQVLMHPLAWTAFAKTALYGGYNQTLTGVGGVNAPGGFALGPSSVQGRLPFPFTVNMSPFIPFDKVNKKFDMYAVDSNNVGVLIEREALTTERFDDPARDIQNIKLKERYGIGTLFEGRAIAVAKNIALDKSFERPIRVKELA